MILPVLALLLQSGFVFSEIRPWRWSEGRGEFIPALSAVLDNRTGQDFATARFLVRVRCSSGGTREYAVLLRDVLMGRQRVEATAYDAIGVVESCDGESEVVSLEVSPYAPQERPAFVVFGFSVQRPGQPPSTSLEGILDYRGRSETQQTIEFRSWRRHGARFELPEAPGVAFYMIRVPPGRVGLAGFVLEPSAEPKSPLSRFLRFYEVAPGKAGFLGIFQLTLEAPGRSLIDLDPAAEMAARLAPLVPRPLSSVRAVTAPPGSTLVIHEPAAP